MNNRRDFIKKAGLGVALAGVSGSAIANSVRTQKTEMAAANERVSFKVTGPLFCPYHSISTPAEKGGGAHYYKSIPFTHNPFTIKASGMSGSPIIMDAKGKFIGFMSTFGYENSTFSFDGKDTLVVNVPAGQELYVDESGKGNQAWKEYNTEMMKRLNIQPLTNHPKFWADVEYCTWVEQKIQSKVRRGHFKLLDHQFISDYLDKVIEYGYPKGKMTLDHGWGLFPGDSLDAGFGSWVPDPKTFPDFRKTMDMIQEKGFTPGLWIGFPKIHAKSLIAQRNPNMLGSWDANIGADEKGDDEVRYLNPKADIYEYASEVIGRFAEIGVRKFKIDMSYNTKSDMLHIHKELYKAAKNIDPTLEMEFHVPDIFFTKYTDVTRTNDIWMLDKYDWPARVKTHYEVTYKSSPGRAINLDHIGGNATEAITEEKYLQHLAMYKGKIGYPLVSVLPHNISEKCVEETGVYLWDYKRNGKKIVSDFFD